MAPGATPGGGRLGEPVAAAAATTAAAVRGGIGGSGGGTAWRGCCCGGWWWGVVIGSLFPLYLTKVWSLVMVTLWWASTQTLHRSSLHS